MNWGAIAAAGTVLSAVVIAITVILTARQLRLMTSQLDHFRRATQLEGMMRLIHELDTPINVESQRFISNDLHSLMRDEEFRKGVALAGRADLTIHKEMYILRWYETVGAYVKYRLIDGEILYDMILPRLVGVWTATAEVRAIHRAAFTPNMWENFELLYLAATRWQEAHGITLKRDSTDWSDEAK
jgi:hypothetical protein